LALTVVGSVALDSIGLVPRLAAPETSCDDNLDNDGNGAIDPSRGETVVSQLFYKGTPPLSTGWTVLIGIAVFLPVLIATIALRRRQRA